MMGKRETIILQKDFEHASYKCLPSISNNSPSIRVEAFRLEPRCGGRKPPQTGGAQKLRVVLPKVASGEYPSCQVRSGAWPQLNRAGPDREQVSVHLANWRPARSRSRSNGQAGR